MAGPRNIDIVSLLLCLFTIALNGKLCVHANTTGSHYKRIGSESDDRDPQKPCPGSSQFTASANATAYANANANANANGTTLHQANFVSCDSVDDPDESSESADEYGGLYYFHFRLYIALPPNTRSMGSLINPLVANMLNVYSKNISVDLDPVPHKYPRVVLEEQQDWWWLYPFKFACYWSDTDTDTDTHQPIHQQKYNDLLEFFESIHWNFYNLSQAIVQVAGNITGNPEGVEQVIQVQFAEPTPTQECLNPPCPPDTQPQPQPLQNTSSQPSQHPEQFPPCHGPSCPSSSTESPSLLRPTPPPIPRINTPSNSQQQFNAQHWDWRRYSGLILFIGTIISTLCLTHLASIRRQRRDKKDLWGNLATEEGVNELLRTGWRVKGTKMEVYDKKNSGYQDDDSVFMGGFEQRDILGAEITVTQLESETTTPGASCDEMTVEHSESTPGGSSDEMTPETPQAQPDTIAQVM